MQSPYTVYVGCANGSGKEDVEGSKLRGVGGI